MDEEKDFHSSVFLPDSFNFNNAIFTDNLIPLPIPSSDFPSLHCNQLLLNSHPPQLVDEPTQQQLFDFLPNTSHLHTFTNSPHQLTEASSSSAKRPRFDSLVQQKPLVSPPVQRQRELARQRRQSISDKVRCLQKLLPCERKMDTATTLEEAYKYVRFLQAQVKALNTMPVESSFVVQNDFEGRRFGFGGVGMLERQQLLQVLVNSPRAQTTLYSKGFCVFSLEQLILMNKLAQAKLFLQHYFS